MIRCPDNQINASFIDISRIKWLVFLLWSSFFRTTSTVASSDYQPDYQPTPGRTDGIPERHQRQWIINPSYKFVPGTSTEQVVDKGIRQKSQKSELIHWRQCLLSGGTEACSLRIRETPACIHVIQRLSQPRVVCWHSFRQNSCMWNQLSYSQSFPKITFTCIFLTQKYQGFRPDQVCFRMSRLRRGTSSVHGTCTCTWSMMTSCRDGVDAERSWPTV